MEDCVCHPTHNIIPSNCRPTKKMLQRTWWHAYRYHQVEETNSLKCIMLSYSSVASIFSQRTNSRIMTTGKPSFDHLMNNVPIQNLDWTWNLTTKKCQNFRVHVLNNFKLINDAVSNLILLKKSGSMAHGKEKLKASSNLQNIYIPAINTVAIASATPAAQGTTPTAQIQNL